MLSHSDMSLGFFYQTEAKLVFFLFVDTLKSSEMQSNDLRNTIRQGCPPQYLDSRCALKKIREIEDWMKQHDICKILVTGKMGTGKTTLIEGLTQIFMEHRDNGLLRHTKKLTPYAYVHQGARCIFYDTPGLKDDVNNSNDYSYLKEMVEEPDVLVLAVKMDDIELHEQDKHTISNITDAYGWKIWKKTVIALTFANMVTKKDGTRAQCKLYFDDLLLKFKVAILNLLSSAKVKDEDLDELKFIPVGLVSEPRLPCASSDVSWIDEFLKAINKILKNKQNH